MPGEAGWKDQAENQEEEEEACVMNQRILSSGSRLSVQVAAGCCCEPPCACQAAPQRCLRYGFYMVYLAAHEALLLQLVHRIVPLCWDAAGGMVYEQLYKNKQKSTEPAWFNAGCQSRELTLRTALIFFSPVRREYEPVLITACCTCVSEASGKKHLVLHGFRKSPWSWPSGPCCDQWARQGRVKSALSSPAWL